MACKDRVNFQRFTADQARKLMLESDSRLTDHLMLMLMTTLVMNQKQNKFQVWKTMLMRAVVKETETSENDVSDFEQQKIMMDLCEIPMRTYLAKFRAPRYMLCQFRNGIKNLYLASPKILPDPWALAPTFASWLGFVPTFGDSGSSHVSCSKPSLHCHNRPWEGPLYK